MNCARTVRALVALGMLAVAFRPGELGAQRINRTDARPIASLEGVDTFRAYCAVCHGPNAKGDGPAAKALAKTPADLTTIAKRHGTFSQTDVEAVILGKQEMISHGNREMPIWGPIFQAISGRDEALVKLRVANVVKYLRSIQTQ